MPAVAWYQTVFGCSAAGAKRQLRNTITKKYRSAAGEKADCGTRVIYAYAVQVATVTLYCVLPVPYKSVAALRQPTRALLNVALEVSLRVSAR